MHGHLSGPASSASRAGVEVSFLGEPGTGSLSIVNSGLREEVQRTLRHGPGLGRRPNAIAEEFGLCTPLGTPFHTSLIGVNSSTLPRALNTKGRGTLSEPDPTLAVIAKAKLPSHLGGL